jgi:hypothetical protein
MMTPTPPESGDEIVRRTPVRSLGGRRMTASRADERTSLGCRADTGKMPCDRRSRRISRHWNVSHKSTQGNDHEQND